MLCSETSRLAAVKEQILIRYSGLGWEQAYHPWSENGQLFSSRKLLKHLLNVVIPMEKEEDVPKEPPFVAPKMPEMKSLRAISDLVQDLENVSTDKIEALKREAYVEKDGCQARGKVDEWEEHQQTLPIMLMI